MNARYYVSNTNRMVSPDTIVPTPTNPQSFNRYSYAFNNPMNYVDPDGHDPHWCDGDATCINNYNDTVMKINEKKDDNTDLQNVVTEDSEWPEWTFSRLFPDYVTVHISLPIIGILDIGVTLDDYSNGYFSLGGSLSFPDILSGSIRADVGWSIAEQVPLGNGTLGVDWESTLGVENSPTEADFESTLTGWGASIDGGVGGGAGVNSTLGNDLEVANFELGVTTPQGGGGASHGWKIYDGATNTWFWEWDEDSN